MQERKSFFSSLFLSVCVCVFFARVKAFTSTAGSFLARVQPEYKCSFSALKNYAVASPHRDVTQEPPQKKKKIRLLPSLRELVHYKHFSSSFEPSKKKLKKDNDLIYGSQCFSEFNCNLDFIRLKERREEIEM